MARGSSQQNALLATLSFTLLTIAACNRHKLDASVKPLRAGEWTKLQECQMKNISWPTSENSTLKLGAFPIYNTGPNSAWYQRIWFKIMNECNRESNSWRYLYIDELLGKFRPHVLDDTADQRLANMIYSASLNGLADMNYFKFNSGDPEKDRLNELRVAGKQVDESQCARDLAEMATQMDAMERRLDDLRRAPNVDGRLEARQLRLARVLDSYGRYESAALTGQFRFIGAYDQCVESTLERRPVAGQSSGEEIEMRYCWSRLKVEGRLSEQLKRRQRLAHETADVVLSTGTCLPRSCHTKTLHKHKHLVQRFIDSQLVLPPSIYVNQSLELESVFCLVDDDSEFGMPLSGKLFLLFVVSWLLLCYSATYLRLGEVRTSEENFEKMAGLKFSSRTPSPDERPATLMRILSCFNLRKSWDDFTKDKRPVNSDTRIDLDVLNPIKVFACIFCVASHSALLYATISGRQLELAAFVERDYIIQAALMASVVVDTFFVISGVLLTFIVLKKLSAGFGFDPKRRDQQQADLTSDDHSSSWLVSQLNLIYFLADWFVLAANRYLRLVPLYVLMFYFRRDVLTYLGSGPMWDFGFNRETMNGACAHESSAMPFTFMSALVPLNKQCFVPSWSISNDIFFGLAIPPIILLLHKKPSFTLYLLSALTVGAVLNSIQAYLSAEPANRWELGEFRLHGVILFFNGLSDLYAFPLYRASTYLIGTLAGYLLYRFDQNTLATKDGGWPSWLSGFATQISLFYLAFHMVCSLQTIEIKNLIYPYQRLVALFFVTLDRPLWALSNAILFLRMMTDWRTSTWMQAWAGQGWRTLARLNFAILFTHWIFVVIQSGVLTALPNFTPWQVWASIASIYMMALPVAVLVHVVFENPIDKLIRREVFSL